jgi:hypothetical protein
MTRLEEAIEAGRALGKMTLFFGCWRSAGHFLHDTSGLHMYPSRSSFPHDLPWDEFIMDTGLLKNSKIPDLPDGKVYWTCGGKDALWYAFYWWDRSVDKRGACNSGFYVRGFGYPEAQEAFDYACTQFPHVVERQKFPLALQVDWRKTGASGGIPTPSVT